MGYIWQILRRPFANTIQPCIGIARLKRWRRAESLSLNPPLEVLSVLLKKDGTTGQRAYIDELMS